MTPPELSVIIVSWNVRDLLRACLTSLGAEASADAAPQSTPEIIVVDNASADGSAAMVATEFPRVRLIVNRENRGFTGGNNDGLKVAQGRHVLFLNPDTVVVGDALSVMVAFLQEHPWVGAVGPLLRYGDGTVQSSRRRFPTLITALFESTPLAWHWPDNRWARAYRMDDASLAEGAGTPVDWVVGAAIMTRREVLERVGGFDESYFMYSEELDWCRRVREAGWEIVYLPSAEVIHYEGKSSEQVVAARHIRFHRSRVRYFRKFHGRAVAESLRLALLGMFAVEWAIEGGKLLLGSRRDLRRERMAAYTQLLKSRLR